MHARRTTLITGTALLALAAGCGSDTAAEAVPATASTTAAAAAASTTVASTPASTSAGASTTAVTAASTTGPACGVDLGSTAIRDAVAGLPPAFADAPTVGWDPVPDGGTYDPCATLSAATVTVDGATGGSPEAVLLFHDGEFVGTATPQPYGLTAVDPAASTADTVAVDYRYVKPGESNADASGLATVRYQWVDGAVKALDTLPPEITS